MKKAVLFPALCILFFFLCTNSFAQTNSNKQDETPQAIQDLRRFEIITLGSMPFVTLDAAIVYNGYKFFSGKSETFNPLATANYSTQEMKTIIITSLCISTGIGISDYVIRLVKRKNRQKKDNQENSNIKISEDPQAVKLPLPQDTQDGEAE